MALHAPVCRGNNVRGALRSLCTYVRRYYLGVNAYWLMPFAGPSQRPLVDSFFQSCNDAGLKVVRIWGKCARARVCVCMCVCVCVCVCTLTPRPTPHPVSRQ